MLQQSAGGICRIFPGLAMGQAAREGTRFSQVLTSLAGIDQPKYIFDIRVPGFRAFHGFNSRGADEAL